MKAKGRCGKREGRGGEWNGREGKGREGKGREGKGFEEEDACVRVSVVLVCINR